MLYSKNYCSVFSYYLMLVSVIFMFFGFYLMFNMKSMYLDWSFLWTNGCEFNMGVVVDNYSLFFSFFVTFISSCVLYYSVDYMSHDKNNNLFGLLVFLFVLSMLFLINSYSLVSLLLGWDGLGLVSYLLVIYYQNFRSYNAGMITILSNRIGDAALLLAIAWMVSVGEWSYFFNFDMEEYKGVLMLCMLAAFTKSAQMPFSAWLPAAMAAPTPVSSLVHSSTLVTAGVYLMLRFGWVEEIKGIMLVLCLCSLLTMFMAGLGACFENDLKKIIALSTLSQLGLMMFILSLGFYQLAFFHLLTHSMFKALLFLCAGAFIHMMGDNQDIRKMSGMIFCAPFVSCVFMLSSFALLGFPFLAGFFSKDLIIEMFLAGKFNMIVCIIFFLSIGLTSCYSLRLMCYVMWGKYNLEVYKNVSDCSKIMLYPMMFLGFMATVCGGVMMWILFPYFYLSYLSFDMKIMIFMVVLFGFWLGMIVSWYNMSNSIMLDFFGSMWFLIYLSGYILTDNILKKSGMLMKEGDMGWLENIGGSGVYNSWLCFSSLSQMWQNNSFKLYMVMFLVSIFGLFIL